MYKICIKLINTLYIYINLSSKSLLINEKVCFVSFVFHTLKFT